MVEDRRRDRRVAQMPPGDSFSASRSFDRNSLGSRPARSTADFLWVLTLSNTQRPLPPHRAPHTRRSPPESYSSGAMVNQTRTVVPTSGWLSSTNSPP